MRATYRLATSILASHIRMGLQWRRLQIPSRNRIPCFYFAFFIFFIIINSKRDKDDKALQSEDRIDPEESATWEKILMP